MSSDLAQKTKETSSFNLNGLQSGNNIFLTDVRLFVAGIRMPVSSLEINSTYGQLPEANFTMPSDPRLLPLGRMDRIPVHIFVRETMAESPNFILMFEGYIVSRHYVNSAIQRSMQFNAISSLDILNDTKFKFLRSIDDIFMASAAGMADKENQTVVNGLTFPQCLFQPDLGMNPDMSSYMVGCPTEYLENVYRFVQKGGPNNGSSPYNTSVMAKYYADFAENIRLLRRYEPLPYFDEVEGRSVKDIQSTTANTSTAFPILYGQSTQQAIARLMNQTERAPEVMSPMDMLTYVLDQLEYEYLCVTNPAYHTEEGDEKHDQSRLVSSCLKPFLQDTMPPQCNVMFRSQVTRIQSSENFTRVPTRVQVFDPYGPLAKLASGITESNLATYGTLQYYPSEKYRDFKTDAKESVYLNNLASELLAVEEHTGPWIHEVSTPPWFSYTPASTSQSGEDNEEDAALLECRAKERFCRRQLLNAKYLGCTMSVESMFDPYITPGFPGVVFDGEDTGFAFAGHVLSVTHVFDESSVSTYVTMNFVRHLDEACDVTIPNPLDSVHNVTHSKDKLTEIYQSVLGSPKAFTDIKDEKGNLKERRYAVNGANAVEFSELKASFGESEESATSPQNNPQYAYRYKRRNVCTFEDYLRFMGFAPKKTGEGPEGSDTILAIGCNLDEKQVSVPNVMLEDRARLGMYYGAKDIVPPAEQVGTNAPLNDGAKLYQGDEKTEDILAGFDTSVRDTLYDIATTDFKRYIYV